MQKSISFWYHISLCCILFCLQCDKQSKPRIPQFFTSHLASSRFQTVEQLMLAQHFPAALNQVERILATKPLNRPEKGYAILHAAFLNLSLEKTKQGQYWIEKFLAGFPDTTLWSTPMQAHFYLVSGTALYQEAKLFEAKTAFLCALELLQKVYPDDHYYLAHCLTQLGLLLFDIDHTQVLLNEYIEKADKIYANHPDLYDFAWELYLGKAMQAINDRSYQKSHSALIQALFIQQNLPFQLPVFHARCLMALGNTLKKIEDAANHGSMNYEEADSCFQLAAKLLKPSQSIWLQACYRDMCILYGRSTAYAPQFQVTLHQLTQILRIHGKDVFGFPDRLRAYHEYLAYSVSQKGQNLLKPLQFIQMYKQFLNYNAGNPYHRRHLDEVYYVLMRTYAQTKNYNQAIQYCQKLTTLFHPSKHSLNYQHLVGVPMDTSEVATWIACGWQAGFWLESALISRDDQRIFALSKALSLYELFDAHFFSSILNNDEDALVGFQNEVADSIYPRALKACYEHYAQTKQAKSLNLALTFSEHRKSYLLYRDMLKPMRGQMALDSVRLLQSEWNRLYFMLNEESLQHKRSNLFALNLVEKKLVNALKRLHFDTWAYRQKIQQPSATLEEIQEQISQDQQVIMYSLGHDDLYTIAITKEKHAFVRTPATGLERRVQRCLDALTVSSFPTPQQNEQYLYYAHRLYQDLIAPINSILKPHKSSLIIPDQYLHLLPFEVLLENPVTQHTGIDFGKLTYLLNKGPILYSSSWKVNATKKRRKSQVILCGKATLWAARDVLHTQGIKSALQEVFVNRLRVYAGAECTRSRFLQQLGNLEGLVHLSVHAESSIHQRLNNKLKFPSNKPVAEPLYGFDISSLALQKIDLLVLAACQSHYGQTGGEGTFSLARSFSQAGVGAIVGTLWSVDNGTTHQLLTHLYGQLPKQPSIEKALWLAKLELIQKNQFNFPGAWAGVVVME
jgi:CHAT domain-containing protein